MKEEFEDTKGVIRIRKSKKNRQHNGQKKKDKRTNNDLQNITQKTKDRAIKVITKLPNSEQSYKGKVKTHKYINRQN
jgi:hypothetical protein